MLSSQSPIRKTCHLHDPGTTQVNDMTGHTAMLGTSHKTTAVTSPERCHPASVCRQHIITSILILLGSAAHNTRQELHHVQNFSMEKCCFWNVTNIPILTGLISCRAIIPCRSLFISLQWSRATIIRQHSRSSMKTETGREPQRWGSKEVSVGLLIPLEDPPVGAPIPLL